MKEIKLTQDKVTLVDDEDYLELLKLKWYYQKDLRTGYAVRTYWCPVKAGLCTESIFPKKCGSHRVKMHRIIMQADKGMEVDHIDGNGLNNQRNNMRIVTHKENMLNRKTQVNNTSGYTGVQKDTQSGLWRATIHENSKLVILGIFADPYEAALARDAAVKEKFAELGRLNFPMI